MRLDRGAFRTLGEGEAEDQARAQEIGLGM